MSPRKPPPSARLTGLRRQSVNAVGLIVWGTGRRAQYDVIVSQEVSNLQQQLQSLFPGEDIQVNASGDWAFVKNLSR